MIVYETNYLAHHGVKGMKWGVRRYQNKDGSLTKEGQKKYRSKLTKKKKNYIGNLKFLREEAGETEKATRAQGDLASYYERYGIYDTGKHERKERITSLKRDQRSASKAIKKLNNYKIGEIKTKEDYKRTKKALKKIYNEGWD